MGTPNAQTGRGDAWVSKRRGGVARGLGTASLVVGLGAALLVGIFFQWLWPAGIVGYLIAVPLALATLGVGVPLLVGGKRLHLAAATAERASQVAALVALAERHGGIVTAGDGARELGVTSAQADALLTSLATEESDAWSLDIDGSGALVYGLRRLTGAVRVDASVPDGAREAGALQTAEPPGDPTARDAARTRG